MVRQLNRRRVLAGIGTTGAIGVAGCLDSLDPGDDEESTDEDIEPAGVDDGYEVKLGILGAVTGDLGSLGPPIRDAAQLPVTQLENEGAPIELDVQAEDTQTDPTAGISAAGSLVNAGYPMVNGALASNVTNQVMTNEFIQNEVVTCSPASTDVGLTDLDDNGYFFRTAPSDLLQGEVLAEVATSDLGAESTSTLFLNDDYGQGLAEVYVDAFEDADGTVEAEVSFEPAQASYSSVLEEALSNDPDTLMIVGFPESGIQLFNDYYSGWDDSDVDILVTDGLAEGSLPGEVGNDMENVTATAPSAAGPAVDAFTDLYESEYDASPSVFNSHAYDASAVLILANVSAGENTGSTIRDHMRSVTSGDGDTFGPAELTEAVETLADGDPVVYEGASSSVVFDDNGDVESAAFDILEFNGGELETSDTREFGN
ncbi:ABC transporter substrate-binding protein [Natronorubrum halophilum]|uniref:ABC transporter substrate-binding protein n=1 Tax=Natronorubrum halophilum TaxID=1702106 RepID=UPI0010C2236C|nr:ABC transporter substrate-binding protein [Natronorubrum halophilum]